MRNSLNRKIVVGVLAFFLALSVGYAIFSETITIEGTATAQMQEKFDIETTCITNIDSDMFTKFGYNGGELGLREHGYKDISCNIVGNTVSYSAGFDYPEAVKYYVVKMENVGNVPAYYETNSADSLFNDRNYATDKIEKYDSNNQPIETFTKDNLGDWGDAQFIRFSGYVILEDANNNFFNMLDDGINSFLYGESVIRLQPGESAYLLMISTWADHSDLRENNVRYVATGTIDVHWQQIVE